MSDKWWDWRYNRGDELTILYGEDKKIRGK